MATAAPRDEPLFCTLQSAIFTAQQVVAKAEKKIVAAYKKDPHSCIASDLEDELRVAQMNLDGAKAAFEAEKVRLIASIAPALEDGKQHPTPEMVWKMAYATPDRPFPLLQDLEILDREAMKAVPWLNAILEAFKHPEGNGSAYCSISDYCSNTYIEVTEDGKMLNGSDNVDIAVLNKITGEIEVWTIYPDGNVEAWTTYTDDEDDEPIYPGKIHVTYEDEDSKTSHLTGWFYTVWQGKVDKIDCETFHRML